MKIPRDKIPKIRQDEKTVMYKVSKVFYVFYF